MLILKHNTHESSRHFSLQTSGVLIIICRARGEGGQMVFLSREQKRRIRKNHIKFLKSRWTARCPWETRPVSRQKCQFFYSKQQEIPGTPAGRPLFVPLGVPGTPGRCPEDFSYFYVPFSFLIKDLPKMWLKVEIHILYTWRVSSGGLPPHVHVNNPSVA